MSHALEESAPLAVTDHRRYLSDRHETTSSARPILVIDDDPAILEVVSCALEDAGYMVAAVSSGREAFQWILAARAVGEPPALILLDLAMPGMSGQQLVLALRQRWGARLSPIIIISADRHASLRGHELGAASTLMKPFDLAELLTVVEQFAT